MRKFYCSFVLALSLCLAVAGTAVASDLPDAAGSDSRTMPTNDTRSGCGPVFEISSLPYDTIANLYGAGDHCGIRAAADHIYHLTITQSGSYTFSLCGGTQGYTDTYIYLLTECCGGTEIARDNDGCGLWQGPSRLECVTLARGSYYLVVEAANPQAEGWYPLHVGACNNACDEALLPNGTEQTGDVTYRYVETVDGQSEPPAYYGPFNVEWPCAEGQTQYGFDLLSWYDNDFGWLHRWSGYNNPAIVSVDSAFMFICAWDVDEPCMPIPARQYPCEMDFVIVGGQYSQTIGWPSLVGSSQSWSVSKIDFPLHELTDDGALDVWLDIDAYAQSCNWAVKVHRSQLVVYYTVNRPPYPPEGTHPNCVTADSLVCVFVEGPQPPDPDGDNVYYEFKWFIWNNQSNGWAFQPNFAGSCLPPGTVHTNESWKVEVTAIDDHGARSESAWTVEFLIQEDCGSNPPLGVDYGDLDPQCYPTGTVQQGGPSNPVLTRNIAWLGDTVTVDAVPNTVDLDFGDDGVVFLDPNHWMPCESVRVDVKVTTGPGYDPEVHHLYLYAFKDGTYPANCSFADAYCDGRASECLIPGFEITGMAANSQQTFRFAFLDPGELLGQGRYDGVFRFRLLTEQVPCLQAVATNDPLSGETEDYIIPDLQLPVELLNFTAMQEGSAVVLRWSTASERDNDHFRIERRTSGSWTTIAARIRGAGSSTSAQHYLFRDETVEAGTTYEYRLIAVDINGAPLALATQSVPVVDRDPATVDEYRLYPNYPNPFNPSTTIVFDLMEAGHVSLRVYDIVGREVAVLVDGRLAAGRHREVFEAKSLPTGLYMYKLTVNGFSDMKKMILLK